MTLREISIEERKRINLDLLSYFDTVCRKNGIKYSLTGGTLLGAVRHKGFIPWDDDVDVFLTRQEYEKLEKLSPQTDIYKFVSRKTNPEFKYVFGRIMDNRTVIKDAGGMPVEGNGVFFLVHGYRITEEYRAVAELHAQIH